MKHLSRAIIAIFMAILMGTLLPVQVFADTPDYIGEVKVYEGNYKKAAEEGFTILCGDNGKLIDLNQGSGSTDIGAKGNKAVYLGYKTTKDKKEAITDLALMSMKGGYDVAEYDILMDQQMNEQIIPFVDSFLTTIDEYRANYKSKIAANKERAQYMHDLLNKMIDDDTGKGLGDLLLNKTKYEMTESKYNSLTEEEKKKHADILTIIAQSNGQATLLMNKLLTRAADPYPDSWIDRFSETEYEDLQDLYDGTPTDVAKQLAKAYDDDAHQILEQWDAFRELLLSYDEAKEYVDNFEEIDTAALQAKIDSLDENSDMDELIAAREALNDAEAKMLECNQKASIVAICDYLDGIDYGDGTMLDFFTQETADVKDDITMLYPLIASLSDGQRAGLEFVTLQELVLISETDVQAYKDTELEKLEEDSIYKGVDRAIYEKGGVALTSDAFRSKALAMETGYNEYSTPTWLYVMMGLSAAATIGFVASVYAKFSVNAPLRKISKELNRVTDYLEKSNNAFDDFIENNFTTWDGVQMDVEQATDYQKLLSQGVEDGKGLLAPKNAICNKLMVGFGIAMVVLSAVTIYVSWRQMKDHYKVDFTPIPHYMIDSKDLIGYKSTGEQIVLKNQAAYYKAVESNREKGDDYFNDIGTCADMNGCVNPQWLALYAEKDNEAEPILANSFKVVVGSTAIPSGYEKGIHFFGEKAAFNLNNKLYCWNQSAKSIMVYYKLDKSASTAGSNFSAGTLALAGGGGLLLGAAVTALGITASGKRKDNKTVTA